MITGSPERTLEFILQELLDAGITFKNVYDIGANEGKWYRKCEGMRIDSTECIDVDESEFYDQ